MRRAIAAMIAMVAVATSCLAQSEVRWLEREHDFGVINEDDGKVSCKMRMVNVGDQSVYITRVQSTCGCTATNYTRTPIAPGDTAMVNITYNPANRPGIFKKDVFVFTTGNPNRSRLAIRGKVIGATPTVEHKYPFKAGNLRLEVNNVPLGEMYRGATRNAYINTYNASRDTVVVSVEGNKPHVSIVAAPDTVAPGEAGALVVHYDSQQAPLWGFNADTLMVMTEPLHNSPTAIAGMARVEVMSQVMEDMSKLSLKQREKAPVAKYGYDVIDFGSITPGTVKNMLIGNAFVKNTGKSDLLVRRVWCPDKAVTVLCAPASRIKKGGSSSIDLRVDPDKLDGGMLNTTLTIMTNDPENPVQKIRLVGYLKQQ